MNTCRRCTGGSSSTTRRPAVTDAGQGGLSCSGEAAEVAAVMALALQYLP